MHKGAAMLSKTRRRNINTCGRDLTHIKYLEKQNYGTKLNETKPLVQELGQPKGEEQGAQLEYDEAYCYFDVSCGKAVDAFSQRKEQNILLD